MKYVRRRMGGRTAPQELNREVSKHFAALFKRLRHWLSTLDIFSEVADKLS
jgi:hypothetical protein